MDYLSQYKQDKIIDYFFKKKKNGVFLDIGANDGVTISNTYFLEKERSWNGICIEPIPRVFEKLKANRHCILENCCITDKDGTMTFREVRGYSEMLSGILDFFDNVHIERIDNEIAEYGGSYQDIIIKCRSINNILSENNLYNIDYCSIDTEGAEYTIVNNIDFKTYNIKSFTIENSYGDNVIRLFFREKGYRCISGITDDFFLKKEVPGFFRLMIHVKYHKYIHAISHKTHNIFHRLKKQL
jgi:FkbM family methyltransferase